MAQTSPPSNSNNIRESDIYRGRNTSMGALIVESERVFSALADGMPLDEVKLKCSDGSLLAQRAEQSRKRIWASLNHRYFSHNQAWVADDIVAAYRESRTAFIDLLYIHFALRDLLAFEFVTKVLFEQRNRTQRPIDKADVRDLLDSESDSQTHIANWSESSRDKLSNSTLTALRDFGLLVGKNKKQIARRTITDFAAEHLLHVLTWEGERGRSVVTDPTWRLFFLDQNAVSSILARLAQNGRIRFEKAGTTVVLETPDDWERAA